MVVSTTSYNAPNWNKSVVSVSGTLDEVINEMLLGADSTASVQNLEDVLLFGAGASLGGEKFHAVWVSRKKGADWDQGQG